MTAIQRANSYGSSLTVGSAHAGPGKGKATVQAAFMSQHYI